jgi:hypothetical protein
LTPSCTSTSAIASLGVILGIASSEKNTVQIKLRTYTLRLAVRAHEALPDDDEKQDAGIVPFFFLL